MSWLIGVNDDV